MSGPRPLRVLISVLGLDQHEAGALAVTRILRDAGAEVIYAGRFNLPTAIAAAATQEDVDVVGISCHSWEFLYYAGELVELLRGSDPPIPVLLGGAVMTDADRREVLGLGVTDCVLADAGREEIVAAFERAREGARAVG